LSGELQNYKNLNRVNLNKNMGNSNEGESNDTQYNFYKDYTYVDAIIDPRFEDVKIYSCKNTGQKLMMKDINLDEDDSFMRNYYRDLVRNKKLNQGIYITKR
jgi:uncharacterized protein YifN (PemK superfamily)